MFGKHLKMAAFGALLCTFGCGDSGNAAGGHTDMDAGGKQDSGNPAPDGSMPRADAGSQDAGNSPGSDASSGADASAANDAGSEGVDAGPDCASTPTFEEIRANIFVPRCAVSGCHGGPAGGPPGPPRPTGTLVLSSTAKLSDLVNVSVDPYPGHLLVIPGDPRGSFLYQKVTGDLPMGGELGARMPAGEAAMLWLSNDQIDQIRCWIKGGAP